MAYIVHPHTLATKPKNYPRKQSILLTDLPTTCIHVAYAFRRQLCILQGMRKASLVILAAFAFPACEFHCSVGKDSKDKAERAIEKALLEETGLAVAITCPEIEKEGATRCDGKTKEGVVFPIEISSAKDKWSYQTVGVAFGDKVEAAFAPIYKNKFGLVLDKFVCPPVFLQGELTTCMGESQGVQVPIEVTYLVKDGKDDLDFNPKGGLVIVSKLEAFFLEKNQDKGVTKVDCGKARLMVSKPNFEFKCGLLGAEGVVGTVSVLIKDEDGHFAYK